jgi:hypothetical protein
MQQQPPPNAIFTKIHQSAQESMLLLSLFLFLQQKISHLSSSVTTAAKLGSFENLLSARSCCLTRSLLFPKLSLCHIFEELLPELFSESLVCCTILISTSSAVGLFWRGLV